MISSTTTVAMVQLPMRVSIAENLSLILEALRKAKEKGASVAVFPESAVTGYHPEMGEEITRERTDQLLDTISKECARLGIAAIIGSPFYGESVQEKPWNAAVIFDEAGKIVAAFPKIVFTEDEVRNNIYVPGNRDSRVTFNLGGIACAVLICIEYAGMVGDFTSDYCYEFLSVMEPKPSIVFVIGVMNMGPDSSAPALAEEAAKSFGASFVVVNASDWGFGTPAGCLGGSLAVSPNGEVLSVAPWNDHGITLAELPHQFYSTKS